MPRSVLGWARPASLLLALLATLLASTAGAPPRRLRVMTYNIHAGHGELARIARVIRETDADVVALQEVDVHWGSRSALPIVEAANHPLAHLSTQSSEDSLAGPTPHPGFLEVMVDLGEARVRIFNTHLDYRPDPSVRERQVAEMLEVMDRVQGPAVLLGDLNAPPRAPELGPLFTHLIDAWAVEGQTEAGFTYPASTPVRRIDYVLTSRDVQVEGTRVVPAPEASDHLPVVADLIITTTNARRWDSSRHATPGEASSSPPGR